MPIVLTVSQEVRITSKKEKSADLQSESCLTSYRELSSEEKPIVELFKYIVMNLEDVLQVMPVKWYIGFKKQVRNSFSQENCFKWVLCYTMINDFPLQPSCNTNRFWFLNHFFTKTWFFFLFFEAMKCLISFSHVVKVNLPSNLLKEKKVFLIMIMTDKKSSFGPKLELKAQCSIVTYS